MKIPVASRAHRILGHMKRYVSFNSEKTFRIYPLDLEKDEIPLGIYENIPNQIKENIIVTDKGLHYFNEDNHSEKVYYRDILKNEFPEDKLTVEVLKIHLKNGKSIAIPIKRSSEDSRFSDVFGFMRFLNRVRSDLEPKRN